MQAKDKFGCCCWFKLLQAEKSCCGGEDIDTAYSGSKSRQDYLI